jgi:antitoxin ParD1/3/4
MTTLTISLPDEMKSFIEGEISREGYASASEYFRDLVRQAQRRKAKLELEAKLAEGLQGSPTKMKSKDWQAIERSAADASVRENM